MSKHPHSYGNLGACAPPAFRPQVMLERQFLRESDGEKDVLQGKVIFGDIFDEDADAKTAQFIALEGFGLPADCLGCGVSLSSALECTADAFDNKAADIALKKPISFDTDDKGGTGGQIVQTFQMIVESKPNTVILHGHDGEPVACAVMKDIVSQQVARKLRFCPNGTEYSEDQLMN